MPKKTDDQEEAGAGVREELLAPKEVSVPEGEVVTLRLKQQAYWKGEFCKEGTPFTYPRAEAEQILKTTELFTAA